MLKVLHRYTLLLIAAILIFFFGAIANNFLLRINAREPFSNMLINPLGGNVGIGTDSPSEVLDVQGNIKSSGTICDGQGNCLDAVTGGTGSSPTHSLDAADGNPIDVLYVNNIGDVGIGTTAPAQKLDVEGKTRTNDLIVDNARNCSKLYTDTAGNVLCGIDRDTNSGGDITSVSTGTGLIGGNDTGDVALEPEQST